MEVRDERSNFKECPGQQFHFPTANQRLRSQRKHRVCKPLSHSHQSQTPVPHTKASGVFMHPSAWELRLPPNTAPSLQPPCPQLRVDLTRGLANYKVHQNSRSMQGHEVMFFGEILEKMKRIEIYHKASRKKRTRVKCGPGGPALWGQFGSGLSWSSR